MGQRKLKKKRGAKVEGKEVAVKAESAIAVASDLASWGKREIRSSSIIIPQILKMELMSDAVAEGRAKFGQFIDSLTGSLLGSIESPLVIVPIEIQEKWIVYDMVQSRGQTSREFKETLPVTAYNENLKFKDGAIERDRVMDVYCLLEADVKALPKDWAEKGLKPLPKIFSFRRTSLRAGKKLYTQMYITNESKGLPPPAVTIEILGKATDGDKGKYITLDVRPGRLSTPTEMQLAFHWYQAINAGHTKADGEPATGGTSVSLAGEGFDSDEEIPF